MLTAYAPAGSVSLPMFEATGHAAPTAPARQPAARVTPPPADEDLSWMHETARKLYRSEGNRELCRILEDVRGLRRRVGEFLRQHDDEECPCEWCESQADSVYAAIEDLNGLHYNLGVGEMAIGSITVTPDR